MKFFKSILFTLLFATFSYAQVGKDTDNWNWVQAKDYHKSMVQITVPVNVDMDRDGDWDDRDGDGEPDIYSSLGTGTVVYIDKSKVIVSKSGVKGYIGYVITAAHVIGNMPYEPQRNILDIQITYQDHEKANKSQIVYRNISSDCAIIKCWVPENVPAAKLAEEHAKPGDYLEFVGLGGRSPVDKPRRFSGHSAIVSDEDELFSHDVLFVPGDSGGAVFNANGELVGVISGGWFWWDGVISPSDGPIQTTWPAKSCGLRPMEKLFEKLMQKIEDERDL